MCGISGIISLSRQFIPDLEDRLSVMNHLLRHRGPDGAGVWLHPHHVAGLAHRRLAIIDTVGGVQPMHGAHGNVLVCNGELYNYLELRAELEGIASFQTSSDTEVLLRCYEHWGTSSLKRFKGMYSFAFWNEADGELFAARDRFGIKPFYYCVVGDLFYFASEAKALLPFLPILETDLKAFSEYLTFQFCLNGHTMFRGVHELPPGHQLHVKNSSVRITRYWEPVFKPDFDHTHSWFEHNLREQLQNSINLHLRSDVPIGAYVSGGLDSSVVASLARTACNGGLLAFTGKFSSSGEDFDESRYARHLCKWGGLNLHEIDITAQDFINKISDVIYALDYPVAGPGSFSQFMVSSLAAQHRKVVLGGQGGDEIFGGYARYLIAYFEQCIKAAIDGTMHDGDFIVTYESIIPNLRALKSYKPLLKQFWSQGLFEPMDRRYFSLINRAPLLGDAVRWELLNGHDTFEAFSGIFNGSNVDQKASYFDAMTNFDLKALLPALLHVEDRMSMAHGLEARTPLLDHELVEMACSAPSNIKFKNGTMKHLFKQVIKPFLPPEILSRTDKMGFPTPFNDWLQGEAREFILDTFNSQAARSRELVDNRRILGKLEQEPRFGRTIWGLLCLELWQQEFHDRWQTYDRITAKTGLFNGAASLNDTTHPTRAIG